MLKDIKDKKSSILLSQIPITSIYSKKGKHNYYENLLEIIIYTSCYIFDIDSENNKEPREIDFIEDLEQLGITDTNRFVNSGFSHKVMIPIKSSGILYENIRVN